MKLLTHLGVGAVMACVLCACVGSHPAPIFVPPVEWNEPSGTGLDLPGSLAELSIRLEDDGSASVRGIPRGTTVEAADDAKCFDVDSFDDLYSGSATWTSVASRTIRLDYGESSVLLVAGGGLFGSQDWSWIRFKICDPASEITLSYACGDIWGTDVAAQQFVPCLREED